MKKVIQFFCDNVLYICFISTTTNQEAMTVYTNKFFFFTSNTPIDFIVIQTHRQWREVEPLLWQRQCHITAFSELFGAPDSRDVSMVRKSRMWDQCPRILFMPRVNLL